MALTTGALTIGTAGAALPSHYYYSYTKKLTANFYTANCKRPLSLKHLVSTKCSEAPQYTHIYFSVLYVAVMGTWHDFLSCHFKQL